MVLARRPTRRSEPPTSGRRSLGDYGQQVLTVPMVEPTIGREMAGEDQVDRYRLGSYLLEDEHPSKILQTRSDAQHRLGELYDHMLDTDTELAAIEAKRREAVLRLPRIITPADSSPLARETADFCRQALSIIPDLGSTLSHQLTSRAKGIAIDELMWERISRGPLTGAILPVAAVDRPMWRFLFRQGQLYVRRTSGEPVLAPAHKFLVMRHGTKDSAWGKGLLDYVYWVWFISKHGWKWWAHNVEKWASPTAIAKYPAKGRGLDDSQRGADQAVQQRALTIAKNFQSNYALAIPDNFIIELLEASRSGDAGYGPFTSACGRAKALMFLGEVNTSGLRPGTGSYASDEVAQDIKAEKIDLDGHDLGANVKDNWLRPIVQINYGIDAPVPNQQVLTIDAADRELRQTGIEKVLAAGESVPRSYFFLTFQVPEPQEGEEVVQRKPPAAAPPVPPSQPDPAKPDAAVNDEPPVDDDDTSTPSDPAQTSHRGGRVVFLQSLANDLLTTAQQRDAAMSSLAAAYMDPLLEQIATHQASVLSLWDDGAFASGTGMTRLAELRDPTAHAQLIQAVDTHGIGLALGALIDDGIPASSFLTRPPANPNTPQVALAAGVPPGASAPRDPATAESYWRGLLGLDEGAFGALSDEARRHAFGVAGVTEATLLVEIQALTQQAVAEGWTRDRFREELAALYERQGMTPTSDWHADLILQQAMSQANAWARWENTVNNPVAHRLTPYLYWASLGDSHVRERRGHNHAVMHERTFAITHEIWRTWWYPAGFNCRCYVGAINSARAKRLGLVGAEPTGPWPSAPEGGLAQPDPGFRGAPSLRNLGDISTQRLREVVAQAQAQRSPDLLAALRILLRKLLGPLADVLGLDDSTSPTRRLA